MLHQRRPSKMQKSTNFPGVGNNIFNSETNSQSDQTISCDGCDDNQSSLSATTIDAIREVCQPSTRDNCNRTDDRCNERCDLTNIKFNTMITPVTNLVGEYTHIPNTVEFRMRRKNKTVTLQWEPFSGTMAASGIPYLTVIQSICNIPMYPMCWPIMIRYKDINIMTNVSIDPNAINGNIRFYLNTDGTGTGINIGDSFYIYSSGVTWIVD